MKVRTLLALLASPAIALSACGTEAGTDELTGGPVLVGGDEGDAGSTSEPGDASTAEDAPPALDSGGSPVLDVELGRDTAPDTSPPDIDIDTTPPPFDRLCDPLQTRCEDDVLVTCNEDGTAEGRTRCARDGRVCADLPAGAACIDPSEPGPDPICEGGERICDGSGRAVLECTERGTAYEEIERCEFGCVRGACAAETPPGDACDDPRLESLPDGSFRVDLCGAGDEYRQRRQGNQPGDCRNYDYGGDDAVYAFTLAERSRVQFNVRDDDDEVAIDTVVSVRSRCGDAETQVACNDDVPCDASSVTIGACVGGLQPRESQLDTVLDAGTWYLIVDTLQYRSQRNGAQFTCGTVRVDSTITPVD